MFPCLAFWCCAEAAFFGVRVCFIFCGLEALRGFPLALVPGLGRVVGPRVEVGEGVAAEGLCGLFLGTVLVEEVVLVLLANVVQTMLQEGLHYLNTYLHLLSLFYFLLLL